MNDTKSPFASKGVWGSALAIAGVALPKLLPLLGFDAGESAAIVDLVGQLVAVIGGALALYGRLTAKKAIA